MTIRLLTEPSPAPPSDLGPYRRDDYLALDGPLCELLFGRFFSSPSPSPLYQGAVFTLAWQLERIARRSGGKVFVAPLDVVLADHTVVQPDVIYLTAKRRHLVGERIEGAPDLEEDRRGDPARRRDRPRCRPDDPWRGSDGSGAHPPSYARSRASGRWRPGQTVGS